MSDPRPCIRCERTIDGYARLCPYCNWDQADLNPPPMVRPKQAAPARPEDDLKEKLKKKGLYAGAGVLIMILAFLIGMVINSDDTPENAPIPVSEQVGKTEAPVPPIKRADTPLVPTNERGGIEQPITSAPTGTTTDAMSSNYDRSDATAVSSSEYNQLAQRAKAEKQRMAALVDPRTLTGAAYAQGQRPMYRRPAQQVAQGGPPVMERPRRAVRTRPVPEYQPIPRIYGRGTARLSLIIGTDGRVKDINIEKALTSNTADLVSAVARWRFRPATEDGEPVSAPYSVDISFGGQ